MQNNVIIFHGSILPGVQDLTSTELLLDKLGIEPKPAGDMSGETFPSSFFRFIKLFKPPVSSFAEDNELIAVVVHRTFFVEDPVRPLFSNDLTPKILNITKLETICFRRIITHQCLLLSQLLY